MTVETFNRRLTRLIDDALRDGMTEGDVADVLDEHSRSVREFAAWRDNRHKLVSERDNFDARR